MAVSVLRTRFTQSLATLALAAAAAGPAQAVYVVGSWDPTFGFPFTNLGWRGTVKADVPAACLAQVGPPATYPTTGICSPTVVTAATVEFYDINDFSQTTIETLDFTSALTLNSILLQAPGVVDGFLAAPSSGVVADESLLAQHLGSYATFRLELDVTVLDGPIARLYWNVDPLLCDGNGETCSGVNNAAFPAKITYVVPEPPVLALSGLALLAIGALRRRRGAR